MVDIVAVGHSQALCLSVAVVVVAAVVFLDVDVVVVRQAVDLLVVAVGLDVAVVVVAAVVFLNVVAFPSVTLNFLNAAMIISSSPMLWFLSTLLMVLLAGSER